MRQIVSIHRAGGRLKKTVVAAFLVLSIGIGAASCGGSSGGSSSGGGGNSHQSGGGSGGGSGGAGF